LRSIQYWSKSLFSLFYYLTARSISGLQTTNIKPKKMYNKIKSYNRKNNSKILKKSTLQQQEPTNYYHICYYTYHYYKHLILKNADPRSSPLKYIQMNLYYNSCNLNILSYMIIATGWYTEYCYLYSSSIVTHPNQRDAPSTWMR